MKVVVTGATGNIGTSLLDRLVADDRIDEIIGIARRPPELTLPKVRWVAADVGMDGLDRHLDPATAVVHLAWQIQPSHDEEALRRTNVEGSSRVFEASLAAGVGALVHASSVGAYGAGPKTLRVGETWAVDGVSTSSYSRHKAEVESILWSMASGSDTRCVAIRPGLVFKRDASKEIRRLFLPAWLPIGLMLRRGLIVLPRIEGLRFQAVHSHDVAAAFHAAAFRDVAGAFNVAAEPEIDLSLLSQVLDSPTVRAPTALVRGLVGLGWALHLQPVSAGWLDMALETPIMDTTRAREELRWSPNYSATEALLELVAGIADGARGPTPPLQGDVLP